MKVDDPNMVLYVKESGESSSCYYARNPTPNTVLVFTIKEFAAKLSKCVKGPYVISWLSASDAVKLSTLEG